MNPEIQRLEELTNRLNQPSTILVLEDDIASGSLMAKIIEEEGMKPVLKTSIEEGLQVIQEDRIDLVILDIVFPGQDGIDFLNTIRKSDNHPPTIVISGACSMEFMDAVKAIFPVVSCMAKPVDVPTVKEMLRTFNLNRIPNA